MLTLIHGDHQSKSRQELQNHIAKAKLAGITDIITHDGRSCSLTDIIQTIESQSLFGDSKRLTIIEFLFRRRSKTELKQITDYLCKLSPKDAVVIVWEDRQLSAAQSKALINFTPAAFPLPKIIFKLTDAFTPSANLPNLLKLLNQACDSDSAELVLIMLARQLRLHLQKKARSYGTPFPTNRLISMHHQLAQIDIRNKSGKLALDLKSELANWMIKVYSN
jgi:hypothetical protein